MVNLLTQFSPQCSQLFVVRNHEEAIKTEVPIADIAHIDGARETHLARGTVKMLGPSNDIIHIWETPGQVGFPLPQRGLSNLDDVLGDHHTVVEHKKGGIREDDLLELTVRIHHIRKTVEAGSDLLPLSRIEHIDLKTAQERSAHQARVRDVGEGHRAPLSEKLDDLCLGAGIRSGCCHKENKKTNDHTQPKISRRFHISSKLLPLHAMLLANSPIPPLGCLSQFLIRHLTEIYTLPQSTKPRPRQARGRHGKGPGRARPTVLRRRP